MLTLKSAVVATCFGIILGLSCAAIGMTLTDTQAIHFIQGDSK